MNDHFYEQKVLGGGVSRAGVLIQADGAIGGHRHVFVGLTGNKNGLVYPPIGGYVVNPFKGKAKAYAGDFCEYTIDGKVKLMKTYEVADNVAAAAVKVNIVRDGYKHIPFVGDVLMVEPDTLTDTGTAVTVTGVKVTTSGNKDVWELTLSATLGAITAGKVLVEAAGEAGANSKMMVTNPNTFFDADNDFFYDPTQGEDEYYKARYTYTPALANEDTKLYPEKMSPMPACVKALNKSKVDGWFNL